jgi:geranylgeranyl diphosphate synthase, type II
MIGAFSTTAVVASVDLCFEEGSLKQGVQLVDGFAGYLLDQKRLVDRAIDVFLPREGVEPKTIHGCMSYSTAGGKRIRPIITLSVGEVFGCPVDCVLPSAVAIEFIHTHSLILDDMPCMDNDDYRRDRPTCHKLFGESVALLAADALLNLAIAILGANHRIAGVKPEVALDIIREVGETVGTNGMIGAQAADLAFPEPAATPGLLERIHVGKTAKLFRLSARVAALVSEAPSRQAEAASSYGEHLGLAFQIVDDLLDHERQDCRSAGASASVPSYVAVFGEASAREIADQVTNRALSDLAVFGDEATILRSIARYNLNRVT